MKPFDLEKAKAGAKICTRSGNQARIICFDVRDRHYPIVALITKKRNNFIDCIMNDIDPLTECVCAYTIEGKYYNEKVHDYCAPEHEWDLMLADEEQKEKYVNVYECVVQTNKQTLAYISKQYNTEEEAIKGIDKNRKYIKTIKIIE